MKLTKGRIMKLMKKNKQTKKRYRKHPSKRRRITKTFRKRKHVNLANMTLKNFGLAGGDESSVDVSISNTPSVNVGDSMEPIQESALQEPAPEGVQEPVPEGVQEPAPEGVQEPVPEGVQEPAITAPEGVQEQAITAPEGVQEQAITAPDPECNYKPKDQPSIQQAQDQPSIQQAQDQLQPTSEGEVKPQSKMSRFSSFLKSGMEKASSHVANLKERINTSTSSRSSSPTPEQQQIQPQSNEFISTPSPSPISNTNISSDASTEAISSAMNTLIQPFANSIADIIVQKMASQNMGTTSTTSAVNLDTQMVKSAEIEANS